MSSTDILDPTETEEEGLHSDREEPEDIPGDSRLESPEEDKEGFKETLVETRFQEEDDQEEVLTDEEDEEEEDDFGEDYFLEYKEQHNMDELKTLDFSNVQDLINMMSKVKLVWPEDMPHFDPRAYAADSKRQGYIESFYRCTPKEKAVMWHAENFRRQFAHVFPDRRPLFIAPRNECETQKLFPTFIKPTILGFPDFYYAESAGKFFKDFFIPQLLWPPARLPRIIKSHRTLFKDRKATSFEISVILVSILNGAGYDSYVVDGYATKEIAAMTDQEDYQEVEDEGVFKVKKNDFYVDLEQALKDELEQQQASEAEETEDGGGSIFTSAWGDEEENGPPSPSRYKVRPPPAFESAYQEEMQRRADEKELAERLQADSEAQDELLKNQNPQTPDPLYGYRPHAWVLVLKGFRGVQEHFFMEPFSGLRKELPDPNFLGIEAVFNEKNYYANIQDCSAGLSGISYRLNDKSKWAKLLLEPPCRRRCPTDSDEEETDDENEEEGGDGDKFRVTLDMDDEENEMPKCDKYLDMPVSWTGEMVLTPEEYERRYPNGSKVVEHRDAFVEVAAPWDQPDGLIKRVIKFEGATRDPNRLIFIEETFAQRKDKLVKRKWFKETKELHEYFDKGRRDCLKEHVHQSGKNKPHHPRHLYYYHDLHPQNVTHREITKDCLIEEFEHRDDLLYYRAIYYGGYLCHTLPEAADFTEDSKARAMLDLMRGEERGSTRPRRKILRIDELYHRNPAIEDPNQDMAEKRILLAEGKIFVNFHYGNENFTRQSLEFFKPKGADFESASFKPEDCIEYRVDPFALPLSNYEKFLILEILAKDEVRAKAGARQSEDEIFLTVTRRVQEDWTHEMEPSPYARTTRPALENEEATADEEDPSVVDFATAYIEKYGRPRNRKDEINLKKIILKDAREKILKKAKKIEKEYKQASSALELKMLWYDKMQESLSQKDTEEFLMYYKRELFKMQILDQRLARLKETAPASLNRLLMEILQHPLLNVFAKRKREADEKAEQDRLEEMTQKALDDAAKAPKDICGGYKYKFVELKKQEVKNTESGMNLSAIG